MSTTRPPLVKPGFPWGALASLFGSLAYGVSPLDILPDVIPLLGFLDDAVAVPLFFILAVLGFIRYRRRMKDAHSSGALTVPAKTVVSPEPVIPQTISG